MVGLQLSPYSHFSNKLFWLSCSMSVSNVAKERQQLEDI